MGKHSRGSRNGSGSFLFHFSSFHCHGASDSYIHTVPTFIYTFPSPPHPHKKLVADTAHSFFSNKPAVIGVFTTVGLISASILAYFIYYFLTKRRLARERELEDEDFAYYEKNVGPTREPEYSTSHNNTSNNSNNQHDEGGHGVGEELGEEHAVGHAVEGAYPDREFYGYGVGPGVGMGNGMEDQPIEGAVNPRAMLVRKPTYSGVEFPPGAYFPDGNGNLDMNVNTTNPDYYQQQQYQDPSQYSTLR